MQTFLKINLIEIKYKIIYILLSIFITSEICYTFIYEILEILSQPLQQNEDNGENLNLIFLNIFDPFKTYILIAIIMGFHLNIPYIIWSIFIFLNKGLNKKQKKTYFIKTIFFINFLILINILFFKKILCIIIQFLLVHQNINSNDFLNVLIQVEVKNYLILLYKFIFIFNIYTILPWIKNFRNDFIFLYKKWIYFLSLIIISIITPPDIIYLFLTWLPLIIIFEILHILTKIEKKY